MIAEQPKRHEAILTATEAAAYLGLTEAAASPETALRTLDRLVSEGRISPLRWCKTRLYHRSNLDSFVDAELAALNSDTQAEGNRLNRGTDAEHTTDGHKGGDNGGANS